MLNHQKRMFSEDGENRLLLTEEELSDECLHAAATIVVASVLGCEFVDRRLDDGYKWSTSVSRIQMSGDDWWPEESFAAHAAIHEAGSMAVAKRHGRGYHLILLGMENSETDRLLDDPKVWKAIEALAQFIRDNYEGKGCYGALGTASPGGDSPALKLIKSMDLPSLTFAWRNTPTGFQPMEARLKLRRYRMFCRRADSTREPPHDHSL